MASIQQQIIDNYKIISAFSGRACGQTVKPEFEKINRSLQAFGGCNAGLARICPVSGKSETDVLIGRAHV